MGHVSTHNTIHASSITHSGEIRLIKGVQNASVTPFDISIIHQPLPGVSFFFKGQGSVFKTHHTTKRSK